MPPRLRIGLTGGIASGKTTVANRFLELGVPVIDADESARLVVAPGTPGLAAIVAHFGSGMLTAAGELNRRALRDHIFSAVQERKTLEAMLHPLIRADMETRATGAAGAYLIMSIPLLVEGGRTHQPWDRILVVDLPEDVQIARLVSRDGGTEEQARAMVAAQATRHARLAAADDVLINSGSVSDLRQAVDRLHVQYLRLADEARRMLPRI